MTQAQLTPQATQKQSDRLSFEVVHAKFQEIVDAAKVELKIDSDKLDNAAIETPHIYVKYQEKLANESRTLAVLLRRQAKVEKDRWRFYTGRASAEEYKKEPFNETVNKTETDRYMKADTLMQEVDKIVSEQRAIVRFLEDSLKQIMQRTFLIREAIAYRKLMLGDY